MIVLIQIAKAYQIKWKKSDKSGIAIWKKRFSIKRIFQKSVFKTQPESCMLIKQRLFKNAEQVPE